MQRVGSENETKDDSLLIECYGIADLLIVTLEKARTEIKTLQNEKKELIKKIEKLRIRNNAISIIYAFPKITFAKYSYSPNLFIIEGGFGWDFTSNLPSFLFGMGLKF